MKFCISMLWLMVGFYLAQGQDFSSIRRMDNHDTTIARLKIKKEKIYRTYSKRKKADSTLFESIDYNDLGKIQYSETYIEGKINTNTEYTYDSMNHLIQKAWHHLTLNKKMNWYYEYDSAGNQIIETMVQSDTVIKGTYLKQYNNKGQPLAWYYKKGNDSPYLFKKYYYTLEGLLGKIELMDAQQKTISYYDYELDTNHQYTTANYRNLIDKRWRADFSFSNGQCVKVDYIGRQKGFGTNDGISILVEGVHGTTKHGWNTYQYNQVGTIKEVVYDSNIDPLTIEKHYYRF